MKLPQPRKEVDRPAPEPNIRVCVFLNEEDHRRVQRLCAEFKAPGTRYGGGVSALFRYLERVVIEDWG